MFDDVFKDISNDVSSYVEMVLKDYDLDNDAKIIIALRFSLELWTLKINLYKFIDEIKSNWDKQKEKGKK